MRLPMSGNESRQLATSSYRLAVPRASFFTLRFSEPRGAVRFALAGCFLRAARLAFLRSSLLNFLVFAMSSYFFVF